MSVQYLSNEKGQVTAVQVPIKEWERIRNKYPEVDHMNSKLPQWHKEIIDHRLDAIEKDPSRILPISELIDELDK
ncbi:addiction module protein [Pedobacter sp. L105]|uniref:addiction module protein n=1 Tax=Pedobacter sp. L105 TaxID=1641871 RepID=UPI00131ACF06|nr:addiction module protein [Pedobacter sp. L105]